MSNSTKTVVASTSSKLRLLDFGVSRARRLETNGVPTDERLVSGANRLNEGGRLRPPPFFIDGRLGGRTAALGAERVLTKRGFVDFNVFNDRATTDFASRRRNAVSLFCAFSISRRDLEKRSGRFLTARTGTANDGFENNGFDDALPTSGAAQRPILRENRSFR